LDKEGQYECLNMYRSIHVNHFFSLYIDNKKQRFNYRQFSRLLSFIHMELVHFESEV